MLSLQTQISRDEIRYSGAELSPHWIYRRFDLLGNALVAFVGEADVTLDHMVDLEDVKKKAPIYSPLMLHFLGEWFLDSLEIGVLLQHLFLGQIYERLLERGVPKLHRRGNDLYFDGRKISVSIATRSPVSILIHAGLNIETEGTPIPTAGLAELGLEPYAFAEDILDRFTRDAALWSAARAKVLPR